MKELIKPKKKKEVFESLKIRAFEETPQGYDQGGTYTKSTTGGYCAYDRTRGLDMDDDILF